MQLNVLVLSGFLGLAAAAASDVSDLVSQIPTCGQSCLVESASALDCGSTDYSCQCEKQDAIVSNSTACISSSCSVTDISTTQSVVTQICEAVGGNSTSSSSNSAATGSSTSSSASTTSTTGSSAGDRIQFAGLEWAAVVGIIGYLAM